jgi:hypothetical protein
MTQPVVLPDSLPEVPSPDDEDTETSLQPLTPAQIEALQRTRRSPVPEPPSTVITEPIQRVQAPVPTPSSTTPPVSGGAPRTAGAPHTPPRAQAAYTPPPYQQPYAPPPPPRRRRKRPARRFPLFTRGCLLAGLAALAVFVGLVLVVGLIVVPAFSSRREDSLARLEDSPTGLIPDDDALDRTARSFISFLEGRRRSSPGGLPPYVGQATVAIEDDSFNQNPGSTGQHLRAALRYPGGRDRLGRARSLNNSCATSLRLETDQTSLQADRGSHLAVSCHPDEQGRHSELYLNEVYYPHAYGIEAPPDLWASRRRSDPGEAALLAGLPQAPSELDPLNPLRTSEEAVVAAPVVID